MAKTPQLETPPQNGRRKGIELEINKNGLSLTEATKLFPELLSRRGKYMGVAESIFEQTSNLNPQQVHPCELKNGDNAKILGLVHFTNDFLKENKSLWRLKFSPASGKYALYNLELLGKKPRA